MFHIKKNQIQSFITLKILILTVFLKKKSPTYVGCFDSEYEHELK